MKDFLENAGYKKEGKMYIPPILQLGEFNAVSWLDNILPELIWIGILQNNCGLKLGSEIALEIAKKAYQLKNEDKSNWFGVISSFKNLNASEIQEINKIVKNKTIDASKELKIFEPLSDLYDEFPFSNRSETIDSNLELDGYKQYLSKIYDRTTKEATLIQAIAFRILLESNSISFSFKIPNLISILEYPATEDSINLASIIRSTINSTFIQKEITANWANHFWETNFKIGNCYGTN